MLEIPDTTILPSQIGPGRSTDPVRNLMVAVLVDALRCLNGTATAYGGSRIRLRVEAECWIYADDHTDYDYPFSFGSVCEALGLDAGRLRARLRANGHAHAYQLGRRRPG